MGIAHRAATAPPQKRFDFSEQQLEESLQNHFFVQVKTGRLTQEEAEVIGGAIKAFLWSPEAAPLRAKMIITR